MAIRMPPERSCRTIKRSHVVCVGVLLLTRLCRVMIASWKQRPRLRPPPRPYTDDGAGHGCSIRRTSGVERVRRGNRGDRPRLVELGLESDEEESIPTKRANVSRLRPDYEASAWGVMLTYTKTLHLVNSFLLPAPKPQSSEGRFGVHTVVVIGREGDGPWFSTAGSTPHRNCVPLTPTPKVLKHVVT